MYKPKITLVNPPTTRTKLYANFAAVGSELPPLGLCYLAGSLRKAGFRVEIVDCLAEGLIKEESALRRILKTEPDYIGLSSYTPYIYSTHHLAEEIKKVKNLPIIIGGGHITALPQDTMERFPAFDIGVIGEGEETLLELISKLETQNPELGTIKGIIYREGKNIIKTERRPYIEDLDKLPLPAWDLLPYLPKYYSPPADSLGREPATSLITSRGCPGKCIFCNLTMFGNVGRTHSPDYIIDMIKDLIKRYKIREINFVDDTIFVHKKVIREVCERIIKEKFDLTWTCYGRVDMVDDELLKMMRKAGCWQIAYGLETGNPEILKFIKKGITIEEAESAVRRTVQAGIKVRGLFMLGNFLETKETIKQTIKFIKRLPLSDFHMTYFTPFPGSLSYKMAKDYGEFNPDFENLDMFTPSFIPQDLSRKELEYYFKYIYRTFYLRPKIVWYYFKKLKNKRARRKLILGLISFLKKFLFPNFH